MGLQQRTAAVISQTLVRAHIYTPSTHIGSVKIYHIEADYDLTECVKKSPYKENTINLRKKQYIEIKREDKLTSAA